MARRATHHTQPRRAAWTLQGWLIASLALVACQCRPSTRTPEPSRVGPTALAPTLTMTAQPVTFQALRDELWRTPRTRVAPWQPAAKAALIALAQTLWRGPQPSAQFSALQVLAHTAGVRLRYLELNQQAYWLVDEPATAEGIGLGVVIIRAVVPPATALLLQAPHVFHDDGTGYLAAAAFFESHGPGQPHALMTNSTHRYLQADGSVGARADNPQDPAHQAGHPFAVVTEALLAMQPLLLIQLHGFSDDTLPALSPLAVVSSGDRVPHPAARAVAARFGQLYGEPARMFPDEYPELGATTNVQGAACRRHACSFVHVELSARLRERLRKQRQQAASLSELFAAGYEAMVAPP